MNRDIRSGELMVYSASKIGLVLHCASLSFTGVVHLHFSLFFVLKEQNH